MNYFSRFRHSISCSRDRTLESSAGSALRGTGGFVNNCDIFCFLDVEIFIRSLTTGKDGLGKDKSLAVSD